MDVIPVEMMSYSARVIIIEIAVVNRDNILFTYEGGTVERLTRSND